MQATVPVSTVLTVAFALTAAWVAAGSTGLLSHPLRHALTWVLLPATAVAGWPRERVPASRWYALAAAAVLALILTPARLPAINVGAVLAVVAAIAWATPPALGRPLVVAATSIALFTVYRLVVQNVPTAWLAADRVGEALGHLAGTLTGQKLSVGQTFGGIDFIVLASAYCGLWLAATPRPRARRAAITFATILSAHLAYLALLSYAPAFLKNLPVATKELPSPQWVITLPIFADLTLKLDAVAVRQLVPHNLPLLAALFHALAIALILRWSESGPVVQAQPRAVRRPPWVALAVAGVAAAYLPFITTHCPTANSLAGRKIVISSALYGNFLKPQHGDYGHLSIGMYGNLQPFIESLGGTAVITDALSDDDLKDADALILIYPNKPLYDDEQHAALRLADPYLSWSPARVLQQAQVERVWRYVEKGGTLLVMGEHTTANPDVPPPARNYVNQILAPTAIRLNFDSTMFEVGGWLQSYQALSHPITAGMDDGRNQFGVVIGASLDVRWPARPLIVGRWGFADPGDEGASASMMGNHRYDPGERLGDMVLAAEQAIGNGRVVAFGDPSNVTNGITVGAHPFNGRLYAYLANGGEEGVSGTPQAGWRQFLGLLAAAAVAGVLLLGRISPLETAGIVLVMAGSLWASTARVSSNAETFPDARQMHSPKVYLDKEQSQEGYRSLAYIDNAHSGFYSEESWRPEGTMGLAMNLMRNGYLTLLAPDLKQDRLLDEKGIKASLLVVPAPARALSGSERRGLKRWVQAGGTLILTVGWDRYATNRDLLADYQFYLEKIPLDAFPADVVNEVRSRNAGWEILAGGVEHRDGEGVYVFDVRKGDEARELAIPPARVAPPPRDVRLDAPRFAVKEKTHTPESLNAALLKRGYLKPEPLGHFKVPYVEFPTHKAFVRFYAAWPVRSSDPRSVEAALGRDSLAVIVWRPEGAGKVILVGDSEFATNKNLEQEGGQPFEGMRENADFWRWLISYYALEEKTWYQPPNPVKPAAPKTPAAPDDGFDLEAK